MERVAVRNATRYAGRDDHQLRRRRNGTNLDCLRSRRLPGDIQTVALRKLRLLNQARVLSDLRIPPGNRLEALRGQRAEQHSIRINDQWRICFVWQEKGVSDVEIVDYHR